MSSSKFPTEGESQTIGQMAIVAFDASYPYGSWRRKALDGDDDFGKDYRPQGGLTIELSTGSLRCSQSSKLLNSPT